MSGLVSDLVQIRRLGEKKREENERFRKHLKSRQWVERQLRRAAHEVEEQIDCRACAECCRVTEIEPTERDIAKLTKFLGIKKRDFLEQYTMTADDGSRILKRTEAEGCVFLNGNDCTVYEARPVDCSGFPHLLRGAGSIPSKMWSFVDRATFCPIVYNWIEAAKDLTKFRR